MSDVVYDLCFLGCPERKKRLRKPNEIRSVWVMLTNFLVGVHGELLAR